MLNFSRRKLMRWAGGSALGSVLFGGFLGRLAWAQSVPFVSLALSAGGGGLWTMDQSGRITSLGTAPQLDDASIIPCVRPSPNVAIAAMPPGFYGDGGVIALTQDGQFHAFGSFELKALQFVLERSSPRPIAHRPYVALAVMPDGSGVWTLDLKGQLSTFGGATDFGLTSLDPCVRPSPFAAMVPTPDGLGLYALTQDGQLKTVGSAVPIGDGLVDPCLQPVPFVALAVTPDGSGAWALDLLGRVCTIGDAESFGDGVLLDPCLHPSPFAAMVPTPTGGGLYALTQSGNLRTFGDALNFGAPLP